MTLWLYIAALLVASYLCWRLLTALLDLCTVFFAELGSRVHRFFELTDGEEKEIWLFGLLLGITKQPALILGALAFFVVTLQYLYDPFWLLALRTVALHAFFFLVVLRFLAVVLTSVLYGASVKTTIKSLRS